MSAVWSAGERACAMCVLAGKPLHATHFAFIVRDGENLLLFSDRDRPVHPLQDKMIDERSPGRRLENRSGRHLFPYSLLDFELVDQARKIRAIRSVGLAASSAGHPLGDFAKGDPWTALWAAMTLALLSDRVATGVFDDLPLSYTGAQAMAALGAGGSELPAVLSRAGLPDFDEDRIRRGGDWPVLPACAGAIVPAPPVAVPVSGLPPSCFGTASELAEDLDFLARMDQAAKVDREVKRIFGERAPAIREWFAGKVRERADALFDEVAISPWCVHVNDCHYRTPENVLGGATREDPTCRCARSGGIAFCRGYVTPDTADDLARMLGLAVGDLPEEIRHWHSRRVLGPHGGNSRLSRVDPMLWAVSDPWRDMDFSVCVYLGKRELEKVRRKAGLPLMEKPSRA